MSWSGRPARSTIALPSPVQVWAEVAGEIDAAVAAGREHHRLRAEAVDRAVVEAQGDDAAAHAVLHDQVDREIFDEEVGVVLQALLVERVQHRVAGAVGGGAGALRRRALAHVLRHSAERALVDLALGGAAERQAGMLELDHRGRRFAAQIFDRVLVAEPVGPFDGVVHVPGPMVRAHVAERSRRCRPALRRCGCGSGRPWSRRRSSAPLRPRPSSREGRRRRRRRRPRHSCDRQSCRRSSRAPEDPAQRRSRPARTAPAPRRRRRGTAAG